MHTGPHLHYKPKRVRTLNVQCIVYDNVTSDTSKHIIFYSTEELLDDMHINISILMYGISMT